METDKLIILGYVRRLILVAYMLINVQGKIKDCDVFLKMHAARKDPFISEKYFEEQILAVKDGKEKGWEDQVSTL